MNSSGFGKVFLSKNQWWPQRSCSWAGALEGLGRSRVHWLDSQAPSAGTVGLVERGVWMPGIRLDRSSKDCPALKVARHWGWFPRETMARNTICQRDLDPEETRERIRWSFLS